MTGVKTWLDSWPVYRQLTGSDPLGRGKAARSKATESVVARTARQERGSPWVERLRTPRAATPRTCEMCRRRGAEHRIGQT